MTDAHRRKPFILLYVASVVLVWGLSFLVRSVDLERYPLQVDWANYLYSAGIPNITGNEPIAEALADDLAWVRSGNIFRKMMPHSYLHQYLMRVFYRLWKSSQLAACFGAALLGSLTPIVLVYYLVRDHTVSRAPALYAAAMLGLVPFHALYSRSGWAEVPMALFTLVYFFESLSFCALTDATHPTLARRACWMSLALLAACSFHEMAIVAGLGTLVVCLGQDVFVSATSPRPRWFSRKSLYVCLSVIPPALFALLVFQKMPVAIQEYTFSTSDGYLGDVGAMLASLFVHQQLIHQLSIPLLALSCIGAVRLWRTNRLQFALLAAQLGCFGLALMAMPNTTSRNVRVIMPILVLMMTAAASGLEVLYVAKSLPRRVFHGLAIGLLCYYGYASIELIFVDENIPWQGRYIPRQLTHAGRDAAEPLRSYIANKITPADAPAAFFILEGLFYLKDAGIEGEWLGYAYPSIEPHLVRGQPLSHRVVLTSPDRSPPGAPGWFRGEFNDGYELASADRLGRCGVFVRKEK